MKKVLAVVTFLALSVACFGQTPVKEKTMPKSAAHEAQKAKGRKAGLIAKATTHSVSLTCTASTSNGVTGYFFYRGTVSLQESATPLNSTPVTACAYTDTAVTALTKYFYNAKSFCAACNPTTSITASNEVSATIPADGAPDPPVMNQPTAQ